jgi:haloacetate dehalogenase
VTHDRTCFAAAAARLRIPADGRRGSHGQQAFVGRGYEPLSVWQQYATDVRGAALPTGHFLPEEAPDPVTAALRDFFG